MATLTNVKLTLAPGAGGTTTVTVQGDMTFQAAEVGRSYRMEIRLFGEDKAGDNLPAGDALGDDELYVFRWGPLVFSRPYRQFTVAAAGLQAFTETRNVASDLLDEDRGKVIIGYADINTPIYMPRSDEVYARVTLSCTPVTVRSNTVTSFGV